MSDIYRYFVEKQPNSIQDLLSTKNLLVTFLNPYSIQIAQNHADIYNEFDYICSDGILPVILIRKILKKECIRVSFDMSSLAPLIFDYAQTNAKKLYLIGSRHEDLLKFKTVVDQHYRLNIVGTHDGYFTDQSSVISEIISANPNIVIIGMGTPLQDKFALKLRNEGFVGSIFTCGGFFHQTTTEINYYPAYIDKLNLRWLYRAYKEPYVIKRLAFYYPLFIVKFILYFLKNKK